ncbi:hypothetical protein M407DRAFT_29889 [Tulasnella calospora MUT 4182]|uniref:Glucose receptor Git3 N-terminal domain-containing protein n=1 Tax=Tulasnella calospora MUT 4182 TaxID=1051891 RepID=A0A0C3Q899_9AGAM|nr:hypothetical protein M407DRAFT_29889 [Tulasnella calospora MUT 4182]
MSGLSSRRGIPVFDPTKDGQCMSILNQNQGTALMFIAHAGLISTVAKNYVRNVVNPPPGRWKLIRTHVDAYLLSLLFADLLQGIGAVLSLKWALEKKTYCSVYCTAQGVIQHLGETGVALGTLVIGLHTFLTVFFHFKPPRWAWLAVITVQWLFLGLYIVIAYFKTKGPIPYYAPTPFCALGSDWRWCWISSEHDPDRIFAEYLWMWIAAFSNIALYIPLFFLLRGNIHVNPVTRKITFNFNLKSSVGNCFRRRKGRGQEWDMMGGGAARGGPGTASTSTTTSNSNEKEALKLIWYPISYAAVILPISIARWSTSFLEPETSVPVNQLPITKTAITTFIFGLSGGSFSDSTKYNNLNDFHMWSGLVNVLVFMLTRPHLLLFGPRRGMVGEPPRRLPGNIGTYPRLTPTDPATASRQSSEWHTKSSGLTQFEPARYIASLPSSPIPTAKLGHSIRASRSTEMGFSRRGSGGRYEYPPPGFEGRSRESDVVYDVAEAKVDDEGSFLNLQSQSVGERYDERNHPEALTMVQDTFKHESHANNPEGLGSSWVTVLEVAAAHAPSERVSPAEKLVAGDGGEFEVSSGRDQRPDTPVWHGPSRPL